MDSSHDAAHGVRVADYADAAFEQAELLVRLPKMKELHTRVTLAATPADVPAEASACDAPRR